MRILHSPDASAAEPNNALSSLDVKRVEILENIAKSILQKLQTIEERIDALESSSIPQSLSESPKMAKGTSSIAVPVTLDPEAVKKGLNKMWKYLNDQTTA